MILISFDLRHINANSYNIPAMKEPSGLSCIDGKHLDGLSLVLWWNWKPVAWDETRGRPNVGFGYGFGAECGEFLTFGRYSVSAECGFATSA